MKSSNNQFPLVAIPEPMFNVLHKDLVRAAENPYAMVSVNKYVQTILNSEPMFDYLLKVSVKERGRAPRLLPHLLGDPKVEVNGFNRLKKVRVTKSQYEMLRQRQAQYARDGLRIPISCIVTSMLYQWSPSLRENIELTHTERSEVYRCSPIAWEYTDVRGFQVNLMVHHIQPDATTCYIIDGQQNLNNPTVIVGWNPLEQALEDAKLGAQRCGAQKQTGQIDKQPELR